MEINSLTDKEKRTRRFNFKKSLIRSSYAFLILIEIKKVPKSLSIKDFDTH